MIGRRAFVVALQVAMFSSVTAFAQGSSPTRTNEDIMRARERWGQRADVASRSEALRGLRAPRYSRSSYGWYNPYKTIGQYPTKLNKQQRAVVAPSAEDVATFAKLLDQRDTGLIRLLGASKGEGGRIVSVGAMQAQVERAGIWGGGAFYSFTKETHAARAWSELGNRGGRLIAGFAPDVIGVIGVLGDVPLETLGTESPGIASLAELARPTSVDELVAQDQRMGAGFTEKGIAYAPQVEPMPGTTYVLRSIADLRADVLVAFRVVRIGEDGSVTIAWKRLKKYGQPRFPRTA